MLNHRFLIIDSNSLIHRAYHALPHLKNKEGKMVNAVYGFFSILLKNINDINPDYITATFDVPKPTFRHKKFKDYKAKRVSAPDDLYEQFPIIKEGLQKFNIPILEKEGFEADDIIGSLATTISQKKEGEVIILTGDTDTFQLVSDSIKVCLLQKGIKDFSLYDIDKVKKRFEDLNPNQLTDFKSLKGDLSDNISGVPGIGEKTAFNLIKKFGSIEVLYDSIDKNSNDIKPAIIDKLQKFKKEAFFSKDLILIKKDISINENDYKKDYWGSYDKNDVINFFSSMNFETLIKRLEGMNNAVQRRNNLSLF